MSLVRPSLSSTHGLSLLGLALLASACTAPAPADTPPAKVEVARAETPPPPSPPPEPTPPRIEAPQPAPVPALPAPDATVGLAACDDYVTRYRACITDLVPAIDKDHHSRVLDAQRANWIAASADPKLAPSLADECTAAFDATRTATRIWGCVWRPDDKPQPESYPRGESTRRVQSRGLSDAFGID